MIPYFFNYFTTINNTLILLSKYPLCHGNITRFTGRNVAATCSGWTTRSIWATCSGWATPHCVLQAAPSSACPDIIIVMLREKAINNNREKGTGYRKNK